MPITRRGLTQPSDLQIFRPFDAAWAVQYCTVQATNHVRIDCEVTRLHPSLFHVRLVTYRSSHISGTISQVTSRISWIPETLGDGAIKVERHWPGVVVSESPSALIVVHAPLGHRDNVHVHERRACAGQLTRGETDSELR